MDYFIVSTLAPADTQKEIKNCINAGYRPFGDLKVVPVGTRGEVLFVQAMLKTSPDEMWPGRI